MGQVQQRVSPYTQYGPVTTDADGYYELEVPAGTYEVWTDANWYDGADQYDVVVTDTEAITVQAVTTQDFALTRYAQPVYRFLNLRTGTYFYTADDAEMANIVAHLGQYFRYETIAYGLYLEEGTINNMPLYRFYNKRNGAHFWTMNEAEKARLMDGHLGWTYEGIALLRLGEPDLGGRSDYLPQRACVSVLQSRAERPLLQRHRQLLGDSPSQDAVELRRCGLLHRSEVERLDALGCRR